MVIPAEKIVIVKELGRGNFGIASLAKCVATNCRMVIVKVCLFTFIFTYFRYDGKNVVVKVHCLIHISHFSLIRCNVRFRKQQAPTTFKNSRALHKSFDSRENIDYLS